MSTVNNSLIVSTYPDSPVLATPDPRTLPENQPSPTSSLARRVSGVMQRILPEFGMSLGINCAAMAFFATPLSIPLFSFMMIASFALSVIIISHNPSRDPSRDLSRGKDGVDEVGSRQLRATQILSRASMMNTLGWSGPNIYIHESGHVVAAITFFKNPRVQMWVRPFQGGSTTYTASNRLTRIGMLLGKQRAMLVTAAAGLVASTVFVMCELGVANRYRKTNPGLSQYLNLHAVTYIFNEVVYGMTAFLASKSDLGHDLVRLWRIGGVHPLIPIVAMIALPLIQVALNLRKQ